MNIIFTEYDKKRMDRMDSVVHEYLRKNRKTTEYLSNRINCSTSSLWRYRRKPDCFMGMPLGVFANIMRMINVSNEDLRYILGLPTGK